MIRTEIKECEYCNKQNGNLKICGNCKKVRYCSNMCQRQHLKLHKKVCVKLKAMDKVFETYNLEVVNKLVNDGINKVMEMKKMLSVS